MNLQKFLLYINLEDAHQNSLSLQKNISANIRLNQWRNYQSQNELDAYLGLHLMSQNKLEAVTNGIRMMTQCFLVGTCQSTQLRLSFKCISEGLSFGKEVEKEETMKLVRKEAWKVFRSWKILQSMD